MVEYQVSSVVDDCVEPRLSLYEGVEVIYAVRPGLEIVPALISLAERVCADLVVYHLGFEVYMDGGEVVWVFYLLQISVKITHYLKRYMVLHLILLVRIKLIRQR